MATQEIQKNLKWWQQTLVYQVYPRSFQDTTGAGEGDIKGVTARLDYLKSLGVGAIWLTPIYPSPMVDNGYDIADYTAIDPRYGTMADMEELIAAADARGIKIVMDLVYNHTSDQHRWFINSKSAKDSEKADWYIWRDAKEDGSAPTNWRSIFGGSAWTWCEERGQYYLHTFAVEQPDLNWENPKVRRALYDAANFWLDKGVGGFRIDAIVYIKKPAKFIDHEPDSADGLVNIHSVIANTPGILDFLREFRREVFDGRDIFTVAEANGVSGDALLDWVGSRGAFSMLFEFSHVELEFPNGELWAQSTGYVPSIVPRLRDALYRSQAVTKTDGWVPIFFENHDQMRAVNHFFPDTADKETAAKALATIHMTLRGTPFIYEGEELGLANVAWKSIDCYNDISSKGQYALALKEGLSAADALKLIHRYSRDNARTPMQWDAALNAGFTTGTPWLPVHDDYKTQNVASEELDKNSVLHYYRKLSALRLNSEVKDILTAGEFKPLLLDRDELIAFERKFGTRSVITIVNMTENEVSLKSDAAAGKVLITNFSGVADKLKAGKVPPLGAIVIYKEEEQA